MPKKIKKKLVTKKVAKKSIKKPTKKPASAKATAGKKVIAKKKTVKKAKKVLTQKKQTKPVFYAPPAPVKELSIYDLRSEVPEDRYTAALSQKEELNREVEEEKSKTIKIPVVEKKRKASKLHLWILVLTTFAVIFIVWMIAWPYTLKVQGGEQENDSWTEFSDNLTGSFDDLKTSIGDVSGKLFTLEENTNQNGNRNINAIIKNPRNLSEEEINAMEDEVFPKLK
ncbi:MAG: hypothetical protein WC752_01130 [Patescibacteria group bacterium]|jgi:hypothetical protein